ncbi:MAG: methylenetetrahydrofolate reductase [NAD(P)H] [Bacteroidia bacterium]|jgi:methylenetetrahydrofolate reductase (NADPH)|nr:methylenetetrahydrofolate reductase [NAD(P)H] [Bacteroidia bacterium]
MKITEHISASKSTLFSFEILPPLKGADISELWHGIDPLIEFKPSFIDVTYHREDFVLKRRTDGTYDRVPTRKRPGTVAICAALQHKYKIDAVPHLICGGFTKEDTENALIDLNFLGIDNVLALRGDARKGEGGFIPEPGGNKNALDLIHQIQNMNGGIYLDEELTNANVTTFCAGAAAYPEKHMDAPNLESDMKFLKRKVEAGAQFLITQMFFDNNAYFSFVKNCRENGINVPIIPGIKPITTAKQVYTLPKIFNIQIPVALTNELDKCKSPDDIKQVGVEWAIEQCKELIKGGAPVLHFYTMGKSAVTKSICEKIY